MRAGAQAALCLAVTLFRPELATAQNTFQEDRHLREYLWSGSVGQFLKLEPLRNESELPRTIGMVIYQEGDRWMEKTGCFPDFTLELHDAVTGPYSARGYKVWDRGRWPPPAPPMEVSVLGTHIRFDPDSSTSEQLKSLELQISIPEAITYRKSAKAFLTATRKGSFDPECLTLLRDKGSYVVSEVIVGREAYFYRRYTNQSLYPIKDAGPADFKEIREGQYQREKAVVLAYRALKPVWKKEGSELVLVDFRPDALRARRGF